MTAMMTVPRLTLMFLGTSLASGRHWGCSGNCGSRRNFRAGATASSAADECLLQAAHSAERGLRSGPFRLVRLSLAGNCFVTGGPERMFVAAVPIRIALGRNVISRGALAFLEWIWIGRHDFGFLDGFDLAFLGAAVFGSDALLRSASFRSTGMPCFLSTSAKASSASSWMVAIRSRESCFSLSKVSSSKSINLRTTGPSPCVATVLVQWRKTEIVPARNQ
jgi:hypothetical protein